MTVDEAKNVRGCAAYIKDDGVLWGVFAEQGQRIGEPQRGGQDVLGDDAFELLIAGGVLHHVFHEELLYLFLCRFQVFFVEAGAQIW